MNNIVKAFESMGYKILTTANKTANGPDMHVMRNDRVFRVEIKKARKCKNSMAVHPIEKARTHDDLIAVVFPSGYVFVEPIKDYLRVCASNGSRSFYGIY